MVGGHRPALINWILQPFNIARSTINDVKDLHLHAKIDVLDYRAVALARLKRCQSLKEDVNEIDRLIKILNDGARMRHWENQYNEIKQCCGDAALPIRR